MPIDVSASVPGAVPRASDGLSVWPNPRVGRGPVWFRMDGGAVPGRSEVLDSAGRVIRSLTGTSWDGADAKGTAVGSGVYFIRPQGAGNAGRVVVIRS